MAKKQKFVKIGSIVIAAAAVIGVILYIYDSASSKLYFNRINGRFVRVGPLSASEINPHPKYPYDYDSKSFGKELIAENAWEDNSIRAFGPVPFSMGDQGNFDVIESPVPRHSMPVVVPEGSTRRSSAVEAENERRSPNQASDVIVKVADKSAIEIIEAANGNDFETALSNMKDYLEQHPDDLFGNILLLDLYSRLNDQENLKEGLEYFKTKFPSNGDDIQEFTVLLHEQTLAAMNAMEKNNHVNKRRLEVIKKYEPDFGFYTSAEQSIDTYDKGPFSQEELEYLYTNYNDVPNFLETGPAVLLFPGSLSYPNYLELQTFVKTQRVESEFLLISGKPREAETLALNCVKLSIGLLQNSRYIISHLIGVAIQSISLKNLETIYLNGYQSPEDLAEAFERYRQYYLINMDFWDSELGWSHPAVGTSGGMLANLLEATVRGMVPQAISTNLLTAVSVYHYYLKYGSWPEENNAGELVSQIPTDPFSGTGGPSKIIGDGDERIVYSVGPDGIDDQAKIAYDPTNGSVSAGDIWVRVRAEREFPVPSEPVKFNSREEILKQYPNGLPSDPFADTKLRGYVVSDTNPPIIWSVGPDADEQDFSIEEESDNPVPGFGAAWYHPEEVWMKFQNNPDEPVYDPTNGIVSEGNLYHRFE